MNRPASERLRVVLEMEERREKAARETMQAALRAWEAEQGRLQDLARYQEEYHAQARQQQSAIQSSQQLMGWQQFITQVGQAMEQQQRQLERLQARLDQARGAWRAAWEKRDAMARHIERCRERERADQDRREQKVVDEAANLRYARPNNQRRG